MWFGYTHVERSRRGGCSTAAGDVLAEPTGKKHDERMIEGNSDSEKGSWLLSLEFSFSSNSFSLGLWFCSEYFVVPTTAPHRRVSHEAAENDKSLWLPPSPPGLERTGKMQ